MGKLKKVVDELEDAAPGGKLLKGVLGNQKLGVNDVLFGRGTGISSYSGNINFRCIVMEYKVGASWYARCMDFFIVCVTRTTFEHLNMGMRVHGLVEPLSSLSHCPLRGRSREPSTNKSCSRFGCILV